MLETVTNWTFPDVLLLSGSLVCMIDSPNSPFPPAQSIILTDLPRYPYTADVITRLQLAFQTAYSGRLQPTSSPLRTSPLPFVIIRHPGFVYIRTNRPNYCFYNFFIILSCISLCQSCLSLSHPSLNTLIIFSLYFLSIISVTIIINYDFFPRRRISNSNRSLAKET